MFKNFPRVLARHGQHGGAAIEYIIVSLFAAVVALAAITYVGKVLKQKVDDIASKMGVESDEFDVGLDGL
jgi:Flp pilus assembly pilin Flp